MASAAAFHAAAAAAAQAKKQKAAELEVRRKEHVRAAIMGQNFIEGEQSATADHASISQPQ
jgi:hypothetical protein